MSALAIDHRIADDQVVWAFGPKMTPVLEVDPGTVVTLAMKDGLNGQITREDQLVRDILTDLDLTHVNGATGPIAVRGAEPGDSLVVDILAIRTAASGVALVIPGVGQLHRHGLDARTKLFDVDGETIRMNERISFPIRPATSRRSSRRRSPVSTSTSGASTPPGPVGGAPPIEAHRYTAPPATVTRASSRRQPSTPTGSIATSARPMSRISEATKSATARSSGVPVARNPSGLEPIAERRSTTCRR